MARTYIILFNILLLVKHPLYISNLSPYFLALEMKVSVAESGKSKDQTKPDDERIVLNFIEAIHVAEERQAERDAHIFSEEKRKLKVLFLHDS